MLRHILEVLRYIYRLYPTLPQFHKQNSVLNFECSVDDYPKYLSANVDYDFVKSSIETDSVPIRESLYVMHRFI